jgi:hypothetical protein
MKTIEVTLYKFSELSEDAQKKACNDYAAKGYQFNWQDENNDTLEKFCDLFDVK